MTAREIVLDGGSPWGFRMHGGIDVQQPLKISRVNPGSKAAARGIREGDIITSINGENTRDRTNAEAHALLKDAGNTLKLGLNEDYSSSSSSSPKKRQYNNKTVQQETHTETIKRSNITSSTYIVSTTKSQTDIENTNIDTRGRSAAKENNDRNGIKINGESKSNVKDCFSDRSTISSNYSSAASTPSTLTDSQVGVEDNVATTDVEHKLNTTNSSVNMADNNNIAGENSSRSKKRRRTNSGGKKKGKKVNNNNSGSETNLDKNIVTVTDSERLCDNSAVTKDKPEIKTVTDNLTAEVTYRVESPKTVQKIRKKTPVKSRSLDDDDQIKIQELSEFSETDEKSQCNAIIVEAEGDDVEWEITKELIINETVKEEKVHTMTTESLKLEEKIPTKIISPEDESNLRYFLEGLNLVLSPEEAARSTQETKQSVEVIRAKRAKKREELAQYFLPVYQNPRFLDVISEEGSDLSDREQRQRSASRNKNHHYENFVPKKTIITETDSIATPIISDTCTTSVAESSSGVEIVYLETSGSETSSEIDESADFDDPEEDMSSYQDNSDPFKVPSCQLTPPPTPDDISPKNGVISDNVNVFVEEALEMLRISNHSGLKKMLNDTRFQYLPMDLQQKIHTLDILELNVPKPMQRINVISPSILSECSEDSSSRGTSLCTTIYKEDETIVQILTLRELCLKTLVSLPYGRDMLQELADVSKSIQELTNNLSSSQPHVNLSNNNPPALTITENRVLTQHQQSNTNSSFELISVKESDNKMPENAKEKWVGIPTEDPQLVVCLSPTQKSYLETTKQIPNEADNLLDLHNKFLERRFYSDDINELDESRSNQGDVSNRLLAIIRNSAPSKPETSTSVKREDRNEYIAAKAKTLPRSNSLDESSNENARLHARNLSEWLQLARNKSKSETNLNVYKEMKHENLIAINIQKKVDNTNKRRGSLPQELYVQQMQYLIQKEKEIQQEMERLEEEKRKLTSEMDNTRQFDPTKYHISKNQDIAIHNEELEKSNANFTPTPSTERFRQQMYNEYMRQIAERHDRQHNKVIKISSHQQEAAKEKLQVTHVNDLEDEFMNKVKQRKIKYGLNSEDSADYASFDRSDAEDAEPILVMDGDLVSEAKQLPKHLKEFVDITRKAADAIDNEDEDGIWSPGQRDSFSPSDSFQRQTSQDQDRSEESAPPVWTPKSAGSSPLLERKEFRPVSFESPILGRKQKFDASSTSTTPIDPPWRGPGNISDLGVALSSSLEKRIPNSYSAPASGFTDFSTSPRLPKAQNPTITLLQKARGGHLPKGASYIEQNHSTTHLSKHESPPRLGPGEIVYEIKNEYTSESESERPKRMADLGSRKFTGIGPTSKDGMPLTLRSEVHDQNQSKWYKRMYDTIHKQKPRYDDEYVTVRYKQRRGRYPYNSGYLSEPEPGAYDSDASIYDHRVTTLDRRRVQPAASAGDNYTMSYTMPRSSTNSYAPQSSIVKHGKDTYKNQPGRIENYIPGHSSISDKEAKEWWDEVMDIFDGHLEQQKHTPNKGYMSQALKESGYESDSTLIFRRRDEAINHLSPSEQREAYKTIQKGGDVPLHGLRKLAPERPKEDLNIEYIPISPNLTRIRVHKGNVPNKNDVLVYPINIPSHEHVFANYKRTAPSTVNISKPCPPIPPSPPKRRSSRNNSTLRLISTMKVSTDKPGKRHETCFTSSSDINKSNVKFLRDKITCKLSPVSKRKGEARLRVTKTLTASPELRSKLTSTLSTVKDTKSSTNQIYSKTNISSESERCCLTRSNSASSVRKICRTCSTSSPTKKPTKSESIKMRAASLDRTFGAEKRRVDLTLPKSASEKRLIKSPDLVSPTEVKRASILTQNPQKTLTRQTKTLLSSVRNGLRPPSKQDEIPIKVSISEKGKELLQSSRSRSVPTTPILRSIRTRSDSISPAFSTASDKSKLSSTSMESIKSASKSGKREKSSLKKSSSTRSLKTSPSKENIYVLKKAKKDQLNDEIAKKEKKSIKLKGKDIKCAGRAAGTEIVKKMRSIESDRVPITLSDIQKQKESVQTDSFFQHLFLRDNPAPRTLTYSNNSWIAEKTLALQRRRSSTSEPSIGVLKIYLNHTKPVSDSKFKTMDAQLVRSRSVSPKNVRWEDDMKREYLKKGILYERSSSLPPKLVFTETSRSNSKRTTIIRAQSPQRLVFSETTRPVSPVVQSKSTLRRPERERKSPERIIFSDTVRPVSPLILRKVQEPESYAHNPPERMFFREASRPVSPEVRSRSSSPRGTSPKDTPRTIQSDKGRKRSTTPETLYFSQTSRPVSPVTEPIYDIPETVIRSPSYRKIRSLHGDNIEYVKKRLPRSRSAGEADEKNYRVDFEPPSLTQSTSSLDSMKEYQTYVKEVIHSTKKSDRFKELNKFYSTIERLGELERTTSSADLRPRRKHEEEIIDYDRWKEVRQREKAEKELNTIYKELNKSQKEKDLFFMPKQVEAYKWKKDLDRGLRIKEKSVEDIREEFERLRILESETSKQPEHEYKKDVYKPLWRGNSVVNLAQTMVEKRSQSEGREKTARQRRIDSEHLLTHGIGSRIWSSLSMEQVDVLKNQLAEIYQNGHKRTQQDKPDPYVVEVPENTKFTSQSLLKVRRNSDSSKSIEQPERRTFITDTKDFSSSLSETDKKRLSQSLSKEILERQRQRYKTSVSLVLGKETRGAIAAAEAKVKQVEPPSPRTCYSLEMSEDGEKDKKHTDSDFLLVLAKTDTANKANIKETLTEWAQPKKALILTDAVNIPKATSETESGSTDGSTKTVIYVDKKDVLKKVEYFETALEKDDYTPTIHKPADSNGEELDTEPPVTQKPPLQDKPHLRRSSISRSYQDLKELFGETDSAKMPSPLSNITSGSINSLKSYSTDSVYRSRSLSPNPELYYFSLVKAGDVGKLKNKFERKYKLETQPRRCSSDPQINRRSQIYIPGQITGEVDNLRRRYEYPALSGRGRSRTRRGGIVSPIHLKAEDRFMPHINIISKIASLYPGRSLRKEKEKSIEELADILGIPVGEVEKMKQKFDSPDRNMSLLGHMFTSSPNLHELRDIAPYLAASWTAHKYPKKEDNMRPVTPPNTPPTPSTSKLSSPTSKLSSPTSKLSSPTLKLSSPTSKLSSPTSKLSSPKKMSVRPKSVSPPRSSKVKLSSILKPEATTGTSNASKEEVKKKKEFDPSAHRPIRRYQPPVPRVEPVRYRSWWSPISTHHHNRPTVTFKEPEAPIPPPKGVSRRPVEQESPRKYVENEVTIHYRTPVRQEIKEAFSEDELQRRQAEHMKKIYQEERRRKYLQELQDMNNRRHTDNFIPSQKSPIPLNRYDDFVDDFSPKLKPRPRSPEPRIVAKALYNFVGQSARELTFRKGDIIYIRRQVDKNWYEGEHNAMIGLFPANYVEIVPYDGVKSTVRKPHEGQARAKYNFIAQTHLELSLAKGELVVVTRRVDDNWFEGKIGGRKGIFPVSYVDILIDPSETATTPTPQAKPVAAPASHSLLLNGSLGGKESMGSHNYIPPYQNTDTGPSYHAKPIQMTGSGTYGSLSRSKNPLSQALHIETQSDPVPYRALYKYKPQNEDELELLEGDTVYVLEKCDDGWYVGSSDRTGAFGTFPGNYVERI